MGLDPGRHALDRDIRTRWVVNRALVFSLPRLDRWPPPGLQLRLDSGVFFDGVCPRHDGHPASTQPARNLPARTRSTDQI